MTTPARRPARLGLALALATALLAAACSESPEETRAKALAAISAKDAKAAEIHLKNLLQQRPEDAEARLLLAELHAANRDPASAEKEFDRALRAGAAVDRALPGLMEARLQLGDAKGALAALQGQAPATPAGKAAAAFWTGRAHRALGATDKARDAFRAALEADPGYHRASVALAGLSAAKGDLAGARREIDAVLQKSPGLADALMLKAELQIAAREFDAARTTLVEAVQADPRDPQSRIRLVSVLIDRKDWAAADEAQRDLARVAPGGLMTLHLRAVLDAQQDRLEAAADGLATVLRGAPDHLPSVALAANVALRQGRLEQAETYARQVVSRAPESVIGNRLLATVMLRRNEPDRALELARLVLARGVPDPVLLGIAGEAALRRGDAKAASGYFERAAALDPDDAAKRTGLGVTRVAEGRVDAGVADLEAASKLDPKNTQADLALITTHLRARRHDAALQAIARLESKQPGTALPHNLRGTVAISRGDVAGARTAFEAATKADPSFFPAVANLAELDVRADDAARAKQRLAEFVKREPRNVQAGLALAQRQARDGATDDALATLKQVRAANPTAAEPVLAMSRLLLANQRAREAIPLLQEAVAQDPTNKALLDGLGTAFVRTDDKQQAIEAFERLVRLDARNPAMHLRMGEVRAALGDAAGATASFREAASLDPKAPEPQIGIAAMLVREGRIEEARRIADGLRKQLPSSPAGLALEGDLHASEKRWSDAAGSYRKALAVRSDTTLAVRLHRALRQAGRAAEADAALRDALKAAPGDVALRLYAGEQAIASKDWKLASEHYDAALKVSPENVVAMNNAAWALNQLKDPRALTMAEAAHQRAPRAAPVVDTLGVILSERGDPRGVELLKRAVDLAPDNADYRLHYAQALVRGGQQPAAKIAIDELLSRFPNAPQAEAAKALAAKL